MEQNWGVYVKRTKEEKKLIHHITNYVTVNDCANATLAVGASPVMADAKEEAADMAEISDAVVLNIGTLSRKKVESMILAGKAGNAKGIPVVLDPVGCGATLFRTEMTGSLLDTVHMAVIRGNISEMLALAGKESVTKGVDASCEDLYANAGQLAKEIARRYRAVAVVTGEADMISDGERIWSVHNGCAAMSRVTGTGCMCTSVIASVCAGSPSDLFPATAAALAWMGLAGEKAWEVQKEKWLGHFHMGIIDALGRLDPEEIQREARIGEEKN